MTVAEREVVVRQPIDVVTDAWSHVADLNGRLGDTTVFAVSDLTSSWSVRLGALRREFVVRIVGRNGRDVVWQTVDGSTPALAGRLLFRPIGRAATSVRLRFDIEPHGLLQELSTRLGLPAVVAGDLLTSFKEAVEHDRGIEEP